MTENNSNSTSTTNGSSNLEIAQSNQDLIMSKGKRKKRTWIIAGVIIVLGIGLAITAIVLLTTNRGDDDSDTGAVPALDLDDFLNGRFVPKTFNATWTSGNTILYTDAGGNVVLRSLENDTSKVLLESTDPVLMTAFDFQLSGDGLYLLVAYNYQKLYRYSYIAQYVIVDTTNGGKSALTSNTTVVQLAVWSPDGNALVYVSENNIFYKSSVTADSVPVTSTPSTGYIYNGIPDWVYEEEVFSSNKALWFSPDGRKLAFGRFDDTRTPVMVIPVYGKPGSLLFQYPRANLIKYPKAGTTNPTVSLHVVDLSNLSQVVELEIPTTVNTDPILTTVEWATENVVVAIWMNRVQNQAAIVSYDVSLATATSTIVKNLESPSGWLELFTRPIFAKDGTKFVLILSQNQGDQGSYRHIVLLNREENSHEQPLTQGTFVVNEIVAWNHDDNLIYYLANTESDYAIQHLYSVSPDTMEIKCLSCNLKSKHNTSNDCLYNSADFSKDSSYYALTCAGPDVPQIAIYSKDGQEKQNWDTNEDLAALVTGKLVPTFTKLSFDVAGGFKAHVMLRLPPNMDISGNTKYPMLVNVYGGPDTYQVIDKFVLDWGSYLAANKSIIYAAIDGRGSGLKGDNILFSGYRHLGTVEVEDQINVTRQIQEALPYVDATRTAIWGWSYGGYAAGMALATDTEGIFKCGISVAPVTDWALYDSIYTERYMGLPTVADNVIGYQQAQLLTKYEGLRDKDYFLIHGTYDDNVHYQQSMLWAKVLEQNDILFRQLSYPDEDHSLGLVRPHLYHSLENFLDECFIDKEN